MPGAPEAAIPFAAAGGYGGELGREAILRHLGFQDMPTDPKQQIYKAGIEGLKQAGYQAAAEIPERYIAPWLEKWGLGQWYRAVAPGSKAQKYVTRQIAPEALQRGVTGSIESMQKQATEKLAELGPKLDVAYAAAPQKLPGSTQTIINDLDKLKSRYMVSWQPVSHTSQLAIDTIERLQGFIGRQGPDLSSQQLRDMKGIWDEAVAESGGYTGNDLATRFELKAQRHAANSIRDIMAQASPDVARLNKEMTFWFRLQDITDETELRRVGQLGGWQKLLPGLGTAAGLGTAFPRGGGTMDDAVAGYVAGKVTEMLVSAMRSPAWQTTSAVFKNRLAEAAASRNFAVVIQSLARLGIKAPAAYERATTPPGPLGGRPVTVVGGGPLAGPNVNVTGTVPGAATQ